MRIALFANGLVGLNVAKILRESGEDIIHLQLPAQGSEYDEKIYEELKDVCPQVYYGNITDNVEAEKSIAQGSPDFIITVYWPWLLKYKVFSLAKETVNFHPAYLPINRGWYPHVHSIIDGSKCGVTLHSIDKDADTGPIWVQKEVVISPADTAFTLYQRLQVEITKLFSENWNAIKQGEIEKINQKLGEGNYHKKNEIETLDYLDLDAVTTGRDFLNKLRARSFGAKGFSYFVEEGIKVSVNVTLEEVI